MPKEKDADTDSRILQRLGDWEQKDGLLPKFVEIYRRLLLLQNSMRSRIAVPEHNLSEETIISQLTHGLPLLDFDALSLDWTLVQSQFCAVVDIVTEYLAEQKEDAQRLRNFIYNIPLLKQSIRDWYSGLSILSVAEDQCISLDFLGAGIHAALRPFLMAHSEALRGLVKHELWRHRICPVCGGKPDFAFLDKEVGGRWLLCSRCDAQWLFKRLGCPFCGNHNKDDLSFLTDDHEIYRLYTCEKCHTYIKAIDLRKADAEILLPLERVLTMDLDRQAEDLGYSPS